MDGKEILALVVLAGLVWLIVTFYWLRIIAVALLLLAWGAAAVGGPLYLAYTSIDAGNEGQAILTLLVGLIPAFFWYIAAGHALAWLEREKKFGLLNQPWDARD